MEGFGGLSDRGTATNSARENHKQQAAVSEPTKTGNDTEQVTVKGALPTSTVAQKSSRENKLWYKGSVQPWAIEGGAAVWGPGTSTAFEILTARTAGNETSAIRQPCR